MKCQIGDLVLIESIEIRPRLRLRPRLPILYYRPPPSLFNSYGIITQAIKHNDLFEKGSTKKDNGYVWFSQIDSKEHFFYEDEVIGEVIR